MKNITNIIVLIAIIFAQPRASAAAEPATLYSCLAPKGDIVASYPAGIHGIVGRQEVYYGNDVVYKNSNNFLQCFCDEHGGGIQTNWVNAQYMSDQQLSNFKSNGWIYVENGSVWGLSTDPYIAKNSQYQCKGRGGVGGANAFAPTGNLLSIALIALMGTGFLLDGYLISRFKKQN